MTVAEELREWATAENLMPEGWMSDRAYYALTERMEQRCFSTYISADTRRTFALLVAEALESER